MSAQPVTEDEPQLFEVITRELRAFETVEQATHAITRAAVAHVPGAQFAGLTRLERGRLRSSGVTDPIVATVDAIQYQMSSGPCVDAVLDGDQFISDDLTTSERWPEFGRRAVEETGIRSMLATRLQLPGMERRLVAGLNLYSCRVAAFDPARVALPLGLLANVAAFALWGSSAEQDAAHLQRALDSNRTIGVALGILMALHKLPETQAFEALRRASQNSNRPLRDVAAVVVETGSLPAPPVRAPGSRRGEERAAG